MSWKSFPCHHCCGPCRSSTHHYNRQDAREGGESPPLPRNCERTCFRCRHLSRRRNQQGFSPGVSVASETPIKPLELNPFDSTLGRRPNRAQVRRPVLGVPNRFHVPRGTKELTCRFPPACAQSSTAPS